MSWTKINQFLVKEHVGMFKAANNFDVFDLASGEEVMTCREPNLGLLTKLQHLGLTRNKITGTIPPELGDLVHLTSLLLGSTARVDFTKEKSFRSKTVGGSLARFRSQYFLRSAAHRRLSASS